MTGRRALPALLSLGLGLGLPAVALATPAYAAPTPLCTLDGAELVVTLTATQFEYHQLGVAVGRPAGERVVEVVADNTVLECLDAGGDPFALADLDGVRLRRDRADGPWYAFMTGFSVDVTEPWIADDGDPTKLVPITIETGQVDDVTVGTFGFTPLGQTFRTVGGGPTVDLDADTDADLTLDPVQSLPHSVGFYGGAGKDDIDLTEAADALALSSTWARGGGGDDLLRGGVVAFDADGEGGNDTLLGGPRLDNLRGGSGADDLQAGDGTDQVDPGPGPDVVDTGAGADTVTLTHDADPDQVLLGTTEDGLLYDDLTEAGVTVTANGVADDGAMGEQDSYGAFAAINTGDGSDTIDALVPTGGYVSAAGGADLVVGSAGPDQLAGGEGHDTVSFTRASAGLTFDQAQGLAGIDQAELFESVVGSPYADTITAPADSATIRPGAGDDTVDGVGQLDTTFVAEPTADGTDVFTCSTGTVDYQLRTGPVAISLDDEDNDGALGEGDTMCSDADAVIGGQGSDSITGNSVANVLRGEGGDDTINGRGGADRIDGGPGANRLYGGSGGDSIVGGTGADQLYGGDGEDRLSAGSGNDRLDGGAGDDDEYGQGGNDTLVQGSSTGANGSDVLSGGEGTDTVTYLGRAGGVRLSLNGLYDDGAAGEADGISKTVENLTATNAADTITGGALANLLRGYGGNDTITGGAGPDKLYGDSGNDLVHAKDATKDVVSGGTGTDRARRDAIDAVSSIEGSF